ncbi:hypothetical protein [Parafrankia colletiae]|uniref:hypothetical protein n=1 Tax=Parafrankia colletiae TaxID=573497 RepID=UPI000ADEFEFF|nr:hypothetical protein [Parafrankia colletiae]
MTPAPFTLSAVPAGHVPPRAPRPRREVVDTVLRSLLNALEELTLLVLPHGGQRTARHNAWRAATDLHVTTGYQWVDQISVSAFEPAPDPSAQPVPVGATVPSATPAPCVPPRVPAAAGTRISRPRLAAARPPATAGAPS